MSKKNKNIRSLVKNIKPFCLRHKPALIILLLLLTVRLIAMYFLGTHYSVESDDIAYLDSGLEFLRTGVVSIHEAGPSAQIMPGMTFLLALFYAVFGEGRLLWFALKLFWTLMGVCTAWVVYRTVCLFAPKWCGIAAMLPFFRVDFIWTDNLILTETPFLLALTCMVYFTFRMARYGTWGDFAGTLAAYMAGLLLKANIALYPLFALVYLLAKGYDRKLLFRQCIVVTCVAGCFIVPWSIRNYVHFHAFIPLTYGAGNPMLLGTYQGKGYPEDDDLDYGTNVDAVIKEQYAEFFREDGTVQPEYERYISLRRDALQAEYRQKMWIQWNFKDFLYSYLILKPNILLNGYFYWKPLFGVTWEDIVPLQRLDGYLCIFTVAAALILKRKRAPVIFLTLTYLAHIYIYAATYAFERYNASLMTLRFIMIGIGWSLFIQLLERGIRSVRTFEGGETA